MMVNIADWSKECSDFIDRARVALLAAENSSGIDLGTDTLPNNCISEEDPLTLVFVGQYSAGKSSVLSMLTGRTDIAIGEGITTEKVEAYSWNGISVIDTPGIHSSLRPDHDEMTYDAIAKADLLVYVVTNELFDSVLANHFRKLAIEHGKADEMLLIVNKVCRGGIDPEYKETLREGLVPVLYPFTPEQLNLSFLDAQSWHDAQKLEDDPEIQEALLRRCGISQLISNINRFVSERGLVAKLTTPLYEAEAILSKAVVRLQPSTGDSDVDGIEEHLRQQRHILERCRKKIEFDTEQVYTNYANQIRDLGQQISSQIEIGCNPEDITDQLERAEGRINHLADECSQGVEDAISAQLRNAELEMDQLIESDFSVNLEKSINLRKGELPPVLNAILNKSGSALKEAGSAVSRSAIPNGGTTVAKSLKEFSGTKLHTIVKKVGHAFKYKFQPYQAVKITRGLAKAAKVLSVLGVAVDIGMNAKEDYDRIKAEQDIKKCRQDTRQSFYNVASDLERSERKAVHQFLQDPEIGLYKTIKDIDAQIGEIRLLRKNKQSSCEQIESLLIECHDLISCIQQSV